MNIDIKNGISLRIEGKLGENKTLAIDSLIKIAESLQELIFSIAKYDLPSDEAIDLNNFKLELSGFTSGSAIPSFILTPNIEPTFTYNKQKEEISKKLNQLLDISDRGIYTELKDMYPEPLKRNAMVESLYEFTSSFGNSPVSLSEIGKEFSKNKYQIRKFKSVVKKDLIADIKEYKEEMKEESAIASIKITKTSEGKITKRSIQEIYSTKQHSLSYSPEIINVRGKTYILNYPLRCLFEKEDDYYIINNEQFDIIGTGPTEDEAENNFNEEFDYLYMRLNSLNDDQLSKRLLRIKFGLNNFVKEVQ